MISVEIMKIINQRESCDTRIVVMRWSNNEVWLIQKKMPIISVRDNEYNRWKRNAKKKQQQQRQKKAGGTGATVKGWELNDFAVGLS